MSTSPNKAETSYNEKFYKNTVQGFWSFLAKGGRIEMSAKEE